MLLPEKLVTDFLQNTNTDVIRTAKNLSDKSCVSFYACMIRLVGKDFFKDKKNKLYILSAINKGYQGRGEKKPRCLVSVIYGGDEKKKCFYLLTKA